MPSPGTNTLKNDLGDIAFVINGKHSTVIKKTSSTITGLSIALNNGWTSATPSTLTTMANSFNLQFARKLVGDGLLFMNAIAAGIDKEVGLWVASYDPITTLHKYIPESDDLEKSIQALSPLDSDGSKALIKKVSKVFIDHFDGAVG